MVIVMCPTCSKTFTHKYESTARDNLKQHVNRKNSCVRDVLVTPYVREKQVETKPEPVISLDDMQIPVDLTGTIYDNIVRALETNPCVTMPNTDYRKVIFIARGRKVECSVSEFMRYLWFDFLTTKLFKAVKVDPRVFGGLDVNNSEPASPNTGLSTYRAYIEGYGFFIKLRTRLIEFLSLMPREERTLLKKRIDQTCLYASSATASTTISSTGSVSTSPSSTVSPAAGEKHVSFIAPSAVDTALPPTAAAAPSPIFAPTLSNVFPG